MKKISKVILISVVVLLSLPFLYDAVTVSSLSWTQVQRYGGISIGKPLDTQNGYYLPVICNVAGDSITIEPVALSSSNNCKRVSLKIKDRDIYISVKVTHSFLEGGGSLCKAVKLGQLDRGHYKVYYESGETVGEFDI